MLDLSYNGEVHESQWKLKKHNVSTISVWGLAVSFIKVSLLIVLTAKHVDG